MRSLKPIGFLALLCAMFAASPRAQSAIDPQPEVRAALERLVEQPLPRTVPEGKMSFAISHRPWYEAFDDPLRDFFGYDGGLLRVRLDLRLGLPWGFDAGLVRTNGVLTEAYDAWSGDVRVARNVRLPEGIGLDLGLQGGGTWFEQENAPDAFAPWGWAGLGVGFGRRVWLGGGLEVHGNSSSPWKKTTDGDHTVGAHAEALARWSDGFALGAELAQPIAGYGLDVPAWIVGPRWNTWNHSFCLWLGNGRSGGPDGRLVGAREWGTVVLGFQIVREGTLWEPSRP